MERSAEMGKAVELPSAVERASEKLVTELEHFASVLGKVSSIMLVNLNESDTRRNPHSLAHSDHFLAHIMKRAESIQATTANVSVCPGSSFV